MTKFCSECGAQLPYGSAKFCPECGSKVEPDEEAAGPALDADSTAVGELDHKSLARKSKDDLIRIILGQKSGEPVATDKLSFDVAKIPFSPAPIEFDLDTGVKRFVRLPKEPDEGTRDEAAAAWRFILISANPDAKPIGLEIYDNVVVGRAAPGNTPDVDLAGYGATRLGVSRRHAVLRPTATSLLLIDLDSKNGTFCNGARVGPGDAREVKDLDTLSFAGLHFLIKVINQPQD